MATTMSFLTRALFTTILLLIPVITLRLLAIQPSRRPRPASRRRPTKGGSDGKTHLLIVLGSGGHTAEMIGMIRNAVKGRPEGERGQGGVAAGQGERGGNGGEREGDGLLDWRNYTHRTWIVSSGDEFSAARARELEDEIVAFYGSPTPPTPSAAISKGGATKGENEGKSKPQLGTYQIVTVPRARKIHQPLHTTPLTSLHCLWACLTTLYTSPHDLPDLILTNGPATAAITVLATLLLRFFDIKSAQSRGKCRTIYVESWARVKKLSLSGRLLCFLGGAERVLVQWEQLHNVGGRGEYLGVLV